MRDKYSCGTDEECMLLIRKYCGSFRRHIGNRFPGIDTGDLEQAAWMAVDNCRRNYRPEMGVWFDYYLFKAAWREMSKCVAAARMIFVPPSTIASSKCSRECHGTQAVMIFNVKVMRHGLHRLIDHHRSVDRDDVMDLKSALVKLRPRERLVLVLHYGLDGEAPRTFNEIGKCGLLGKPITKDRVRQLELRAIRNLRDVMGAGKNEEVC